MTNQSVPSEKPLVKCKIPSISNMQQRSILLFDSAIKSDKTRENYACQLRRFLRHYIIKDFDSLLKIKPKKTQEMIDNYILYLRSEDKSRSTIKCTIQSLDLFYSMNDVVLNFKKIKRMIPAEKKHSQSIPYTTEQVKDILKVLGHDLKWSAFVHVMCASGMRAGFIEYLKFQDIIDMPNNCKALRVYSGEKEEYYAFIHHEAVQSLEKYIQSKKNKNEPTEPNSFVFTKTHDSSKNLSQKDVSVRLSFILKKFPEIRGIKENGRYKVAMSHGFRKRWNTILKNNKDINPLLAEKMFGHSMTIPLDTVYHKPSLEILFEEYQKAIPELIIDENERLKLTIQNQKLELDENTDKDEKIALLQEQLHEVQLHLKELAKRS